MDNLSFTTRNKSYMSAGTSKIYSRDSLFGLNQVKYQDKLTHQNCQCFHCINDTKPISQPIYPRITAQTEFHKQDNQAFAFLIQKMADYTGTIKIPDTFIAESSSIVHISNLNKFRLKTKPNLPLSQIKKYFDARKAIYQKIIKNQNNDMPNKAQKNLSKLFSSAEGRLIKKQNTTNSQPLKKQKQMKEVAIIHYKNNFSQIVTESSLSKYLAKRKNDPFWQQITSISLIPPYKQEQLTFHRYTYERTQSNIKQMDKQMQNIAKIIDNEDKLSDFSRQGGSINPQNSDFIQKINQNSQKNKANQLSSPKSVQQNYSRSLTIQSIDLNQQKTENQIIAKISKQIVAYFEVKLHIRISSSLFKYMTDYEGNYYLTGIQKFIAHNLKKNQLHMVHDRYIDLLPQDNEQIAELKIQIEQKQWKILQNQLAQLVADCLQKRKLQLSQVEYKRPSSQNLVKIFKKIFPTFNEEDVFTNKNWKNQFPVYILNCRKMINKTIREDQGIRILKRFGITFYRTWN